MLKVPKNSTTPEYLNQLLNNAAQVVKKEKISFKPLSAYEFSQGGTLEWRIKNILPITGLAMIFGGSGAGKSFFILDVIASIARGSTWHGKKTKKGRVIYIAAEGANGFRKRLRAYAKHHKIALQDIDLHIIAATPNIYTGDVAPLIEDIQNAGGADVVVIDTLAQVTVGANENGGEDMGLVISHCQLLGEELRALIILIHHSGKNSKNGSRGWSGLKGPLDVEIEISKKGKSCLAIITKQKDEADGERFPFALKQVWLENDADGEPISSCVVVYVDEPDNQIKRPTGLWQRRIFGALETLGGKSVPLDALIKESIKGTENKILPDQKTSKRDSRLDSAKRALEGLEKAGSLVIENRCASLPHFRNSSQNDICEIAASTDLNSQMPQHPIGVRDCETDADQN